MNTLNKRQATVRVFLFLLGLVAGYLAFDNSTELRNLRYRVARAEADGCSDRVTLADRSASLAMNQRAQNGEYILKFERPIDRKLVQAGVARVSFSFASNSAPGLRALLSGLAISAETAEKLLEHQRKIIWASLQTEVAMQQLLLARHAYDERVRGLLTSQNYQRYRGYEDSRPATREYDEIEQFAKKSGSSLDPKYQEEIIRAIQSTQAYSGRSWHGPYDGLPDIAIGLEDVVAQRTEETRQLANASTNVLMTLVKEGIPSQYLILVSSYYANQMRSKHELLRTLTQDKQDLRTARRSASSSDTTNGVPLGAQLERED